MNQHWQKSGVAISVIVRAVAVTLAIMACLPLIGFFNNYAQTVHVGWWKILLGPYAWYFVDSAGKGNSSNECHGLALVCVASALLPVYSNSLATRIIARIGVVIWLVTGLALVLAWT